MTEEPILLTPGPLTTAEAVKRAMLRDWGSRDADFSALTSKVMAKLLAVAKAGPDYCAVPLQGSGTFAVEAMLGTFGPREGRLLVPVNGAYAKRMVEIARRLGLDVVDEAGIPYEPLEPDRLRETLRRDPSIRSVALVHCETGAGLLNPLSALARAVAEEGRDLLVDSMSGFGALPVDAESLGFTALAASANKCLEGVPGMAFVIARRDALERAKGRSPSIVLDLAAQHAQFEADGQWRFTPPTHVVAALGGALALLEREGGPPARLKRYEENRDTLVSGMRGLGFEPFLGASHQAPIIVAFRQPRESWFSFAAFYEALKSRGFAIYGGKLAEEATFRVGTIGAIDRSTVKRFLAAAAQVLRELQRTGTGDAL